MRRSSCVLVVSLALSVAGAARAEDADPYQWLEEVDGAKALAWAKEQNAKSLGELQATKYYKPIYEKSLEILDSKEKIPYPSVRGKYLYNFWQDKAQPRGIWRRTTLASYRLKDTVWETVIDLDAMSKADNTPWVFKGANCFAPDDKRCLVQLSRGGGDAVVVREFDTETKAFVPNGFQLPEGKVQVGFKDIDTIWVGTDFGPGTMTTSGYPRITKLWKRGTPLAEAKTVYEGDASHVSIGGYTSYSADGRYSFVYDAPTFFTSRIFYLAGDRLVRLPIPEDASFQSIFHDRVIFSLRSDWKPADTTYKQGSLLSIGLNELLQGQNACKVIFEPTPRISLDGVASTKSYLLYMTLDNVRGRLYRLTLKDGEFVREEMALPGQGAVGVAATNDDSDTFFYTYTDFLTPSSLYLVENGKVEKSKSLPAYFDTTGMSVAQYEAASKDGTMIPYFVVMPKGFKSDGNAPTLLYAYGGFEVAQNPFYSGVMGNAWLARGGVFVLANIRGGGEFGPAWHEAAIKQNRIKTHEDFVAVAEDLIRRNISSTPHLGIEGGSNGGLLVGTAFTLRPDLFKAVVCQVPLLDMYRYSQLLAGASWMGEYGDPSKAEDWAYMKTWSPYQLVSKDKEYPRVFFWTTTRDDRVHPGHARKMVAKMADQGHPVMYFENIEGGHGGGSVNTQKATTYALEYSYLWKMLK